MHVKAIRGEKKRLLTIPRVLVPDISSPHDKVILAENADKPWVGES